MAEGARLLSEYGDKTPSRVRISLSPPFTSDSRVDTIYGVGPFFVWWGQNYFDPPQISFFLKLPLHLFTPFPHFPPLLHAVFKSYEGLSTPCFFMMYMLALGHWVLLEKLFVIALVQPKG